MKIDGKTFEQIKVLGKGAYGKVVKVKDENGINYAIKKIQYRSKEGVYADVIKEMDLLRRMSHHPHIISLCGYKWSDEYFYVLLEYGGTALYKYIYAHSLKDRMEHLPMILHQTMSALCYLHKYNIAHRDVKPDNILFQIKDGKCHIRLCDFGLSKCMLIKRNTPKTSTLWYRAPENLQALKVYDNKIDIWPIGCLIYEYIHQKVLFRGNNSKDTLIKILCALGPVEERVYKRLSIDRKKLPRKWRKIRMQPIEEEALERLMYRCLQMHPSDRPTSDEILKDDYFVNHRLSPYPVPSLESYSVIEDCVQLEFEVHPEIYKKQMDRKVSKHDILPESNEISDSDNTSDSDSDSENNDDKDSEKVDEMTTSLPQRNEYINSLIYRREVLDWMFHIGEMEELNNETVFLAIDLYDRTIPKWELVEEVADLKYIALACLDIASKFLEIYFIELQEVYHYNNKKYHEMNKNSRYVPHHNNVVDTFVKQIYDYERRILIILDFIVYGNPTIYEETNRHYKKAKQFVYQRYKN